MKVRTWGLMRESASQRTMVSSRTPQARPKAEVQLMEEEAVMGERIDLTTNDNLRLRSGEAGPSKRKGPLPAPDCVALSALILRELRLGFFGAFADFVVNGAETENLQRALAVRSDHDGLIPDLLVQEGPADRRGGGDFPGGHVRFLAGHQLIFQFFVLGCVKNLDARAQSNFVSGNVIHVDHGEIREALAQLADARLDELLALLGHVVLGILAEVAKRGGLLDLFGKFVDQLVFKRVDLFLQFSFDCVCHFDSEAGLQI